MQLADLRRSEAAAASTQTSTNRVIRNHPSLVAHSLHIRTLVALTSACLSSNTLARCPRPARRPKLLIRIASQRLASHLSKSSNATSAPLPYPSFERSRASWRVDFWKNVSSAKRRAGRCGAGLGAWLDEVAVSQNLRHVCDYESFVYLRTSVHRPAPIYQESVRWPWSYHTNPLCFLGYLNPNPRRR